MVKMGIPPKPGKLVFFAFRLSNRNHGREFSHLLISNENLSKVGLEFLLNNFRYSYSFSVFGINKTQCHFPLVD